MVPNGTERVIRKGWLLGGRDAAQAPGSSVAISNGIGRLRGTTLDGRIHHCEAHFGQRRRHRHTCVMNKLCNRALLAS